jgi:thiamine pyrophosphate-dependent acetolactate synthase large subunit-like protein
MTTATFIDGGDRVAAALEAHGVTHLFTLCGGHVSPILVRASARGLRIVDTRDEATAVFAADAYARLTGTVGVAVVTAGPGLTNTITALKNAQLAQSPLLLIAGAAPTALQGRGALQDIAQHPVVAPHVKHAGRVRRVADLGAAVARAMSIARRDVPGPTFIECPVDVLYAESTVRQWYAEAAGKGRSIGDRLLRAYLTRHANKMFAPARGPAVPVPYPLEVPAPQRTVVERAARALSSAKRPLLVIGSQALAQAGRASHLAAAVTRLSIPVYLSGMARGLLGRDSPLQMRHARRKALLESDCVVLAGVPCDFRLDYGRHIRRAATLIAANRSHHDARLNRRPAITALGDAGIFLEQLADRLGDAARRATWIEDLRGRDASREAEIDQQAGVVGAHVNAVAFFRELEAAASGDAVFVADGGDFVATASYIVRPRSPLSWLDPGVFGTLGVGAGFAIGASLMRRDAEVWLLWGDGASGYGLAEFDTFVRHHIPVIAVVGNDASWSQIAREQVKLLADDVGTVLARTAYDEVARAFGGEGIAVRCQREVGAALAEAKAQARAGRPVLINLWLDRGDFREGSLSM